MIDQGELIQFPTREVWEHSLLMRAAIYLGVAASLGGAYVSAGYKADGNYGTERATQLVEANGFVHPNLISKDIGFVSLQGCRNLDEVKYEFETTTANGQQATVACLLYTSPSPRD